MNFFFFDRLLILKPVTERHMYASIHQNDLRIQDI